MTLVSSIPTLAQGTSSGQIQVDPDVEELVLTGWLGEDSVFVGSIGLRAEGGDVERFSFEPDELKRESNDEDEVDEDEVIYRHQTSLVGEPSLSDEQHKYFQVHVSNVTVPGTYKGNIRFQLPGQDLEEALSVPLRVVAKARPQITPEVGSGNLTFNLVRCKDLQQDWWIGCGIARLLLPAGLFRDSHTLQFHNPIRADAKVQDTNVVVNGEHSGIQLSENELKIPNTATFKADGESTMPLEIDRRAIPPDHYTGAIYLNLEGGVRRLEIPVNINVRTGPTWVIFWIVVGLLLGQLLRVVEEKQPTAGQGQRSTTETIIGRGAANNPLQLIVKVAVFGVLVWIGIRTHYLEQGLILGTNPTTDYLNLVVWGLSADVASRVVTRSLVGLR